MSIVDDKYWADTADFVSRHHCRPDRVIAPGDVTLSNGQATFTKANINMTADTATAIMNNPAGFYFNVHTAQNPGGVARGQLVRTQ